MNAPMTRRSALKLVSGTAISTAMGPALSPALASTTDAGQVLAMTVGPEIAIVPALFGASGGANLAALTNNSRFMASLGKLAPCIFRYPGGNGANWFDISTGVYVKNPSVSRAPNTSRFDTPFTFNALKTILQQAQAEPSIVLNLLTGDLDTQVSALKSAQASGISVKRIELGNEYYLRGAAAGTTAYEQIFPTAADYARLALNYAKVLRSAFPNCQIAVPILARDSNGGRESAWNADLLKRIDTSIDSVIAHIYRRLPSPLFGSGLSENPLASPGGPQTVFASALDPHPLDIVRDAAHAESRRVWVTETNISDPGGWTADTWTHGLGLAVNLMNMLSLPRAEQVLCWSILGNTTFSLISSPEDQPDPAASSAAPGMLTANGYACRLLFRAARGQSTARPLKFGPEPMQTSSSSKPVPALYGWQYGRASALVLNLSPEQHAVDIRDPQLAHHAFYQLSADARQVVRDEAFESHSGPNRQHNRSSALLNDALVRQQSARRVRRVFAHDVPRSEAPAPLALPVLGDRSRADQNWYAHDLR